EAIKRGGIVTPQKHTHLVNEKTNSDEEWINPTPKSKRLREPIQQATMSYSQIKRRSPLTLPSGTKGSGPSNK
ncbi:hypothetical protein HAX54_004125, partial [Datura stramonium]|nr:hypothetical protein [Datura stramonium]